MAKKKAAKTGNPKSLVQKPQPARMVGSGRIAGADAMLDETIKAVRTKLNRKDRLVGAESLTHVLPVPSIAVRYLLQSEGLPLGRFYHLIGKPKSFKSTFAVEVGRWHRDCGGFLFRNDAETKSNPALWLSVLNWDPTGFRMEDCEVIEDWQEKIYKYSTELQKRMDADDGLGRTIPVAFIVDSLMGKTTRNQRDKIRQQGYAEKAWAEEAQVITKWMRGYISDMLGWPFTVLGVNHAREQLNPQTQQLEWTTPGGWQIKFQDSMEIRVQKKRSTERMQGGMPYYEHEISFQMTNNSYGADRKQILVPLTMWYEPVVWDEHNQPTEYEVFDESGGETDMPATRMFTSFDWWSASTHMLYDGTGLTSVAAENILPEVKRILHIQKKSTGGLFWCDAIGVGRDDAVDAFTLGVELEKHPEMLAQLYPAMGIARRPLFKHGINYLEQMAEHDARSQEPATNNGDTT